MADIVYRDYVTVDTVDMGRVLCVAPFCSSLCPGDMVIIQKDPIVAPDTSISGIGKKHRGCGRFRIFLRWLRGSQTSADTVENKQPVQHYRNGTG